MGVLLEVEAEYMDASGGFPVSLIISQPPFQRFQRWKLIVIFMIYSVVAHSVFVSAAKVWVRLLALAALWQDYKSSRLCIRSVDF